MTTPEYISAVIEKLKAWREHDFHADRQLADEVLIADGWKCEQNPAWEGGVRWFVPGNPEYSTSESGRPHVIHDLNTALGVVPPKHNVKILITCAIGAGAKVWSNGKEESFTGTAPIPTVAILIAALKARLGLLQKSRAA